MPRKETGYKSTLPPGHKPVWCTLPEDDHNKMREAAAVCRVPMSEFARQVLIAAVRQIRGHREDEGKLTIPKPSREAMTVTPGS